MPAECDVSIRPGWFYHEKEDVKVRTAQNLIDLYFSSVGRGASFLLNLPVDRRGQIHGNDVSSLLEFRKRIEEIFNVNLARNAMVSASNTRAGSRRFATANLIHDSRMSYWATDDAVHTAEITIDFARSTSFNVVRLREFLPLGQRVETFAIDEWNGGAWQEFARRGPASGIACW